MRHVRLDLVALAVLALPAVAQPATTALECEHNGISIGFITDPPHGPHSRGPSTLHRIGAHLDSFRCRQHKTHLICMATTIRTRVSGLVYCTRTATRLAAGGEET